MKEFAGNAAGAASEGVRRASSRNTCSGLQVTPAASHTLPANGAHEAMPEKSSAPSTTTVPCAWITTGLPGDPDDDTSTCSRYVPALTTMVVPGPLRAAMAAEIEQ